ncbi:hypothetical protein ACYE2N_09165 [Flavobacterium sp. MAHUQ-51]|uniref:hypothetical protein n=1 Tax=Flavobacterium sp. GCM10022190 TaxID=3252639 RepID=UPI003615C6CD
MANLNAKNFTLNVSKDIQRVLQIMRRLEKANSSIIESVNTDYIFYLHDRSHKNFVFYIGEPTRDDPANETIFPITYVPENENSLSYINHYCTHDEVEKCFEDWLHLIYEFNSISFTEEETFAKFYEEEIFVEFEIVDDDSETHPFNNFQQVILYKFLSAATFYLENKHPDNSEVEKICTETIDLRDNIQNLTKKDFSRRFSKILAKIKKFSLQTFVEVSDVAKKEIYKFLLKDGLKKLPTWIDNIQTFFITHHS